MKGIQFHASLKYDMMQYENMCVLYYIIALYLQDGATVNFHYNSGSDISCLFFLYTLDTPNIKYKDWQLISRF